MSLHHPAIANFVILAGCDSPSCISAALARLGLSGEGDGREEEPRGSGSLEGLGDDRFLPLTNSLEQFSLHILDNGRESGLRGRKRDTHRGMLVTGKHGG
jgi:hypothetical protein